MKRIALTLLLCTLCLAVLCPALAAPPESDIPNWPNAPFAWNIETGKIIYLGMDKAEAEAIMGAPLVEDKGGKNTYQYEGITLAFRDDFVVYIMIHVKEPLWAANGVVTPFMPTDQAIEALGMTIQAENRSYALLYFDDGVQTQWDPDTGGEGLLDYQWVLMLYAGSETVGRIMMGDRQHLTTMQ